jgi:hypothetical protein
LAAHTLDEVLRRLRRDHADHTEFEEDKGIERSCVPSVAEQTAQGEHVPEIGLSRRKI